MGYGIKYLFLSFSPWADVQAIFDATQQRVLEDVELMVLNGNVTSTGPAIASIKARWPNLRAILYMTSLKIPNTAAGKFASTAYATMYAERYRRALMRRADGQPKILRDGSSNSELWSKFRNPDTRTYLAQNAVAQAVAWGADGVFYDSCHRVLNPSSPYTGTLELDTVCSTLDSIVYIRSTGAGEPGSLTIVNDGAGAGNFTGTGYDRVFHCQVGVTTHGQFDAALAALPDGLGLSLASTTPSAVFAAGDVLALTVIPGGAVIAAEHPTDVLAFLQDTKDVINSVNPEYLLGFNGMWNQNYAGQVVVQAGNLAVADFCTVEFFGRFSNVVEAGKRDNPFTLYVEEIIAEAELHPGKIIMFRSSQQPDYVTHQVAMEDACYGIAAYKVMASAALMARSSIVHNDHFQGNRLTNYRFAALTFHIYLLLGLDTPEADFVDNGTGGLSRRFTTGKILIAPEGRGLQLFTLERDYYTSWGQFLPSGTVVVRRPTKALWLTDRKHVPPIQIDAVVPAAVTALTPIPLAAPGAGGFPSLYATAKGTPIVQRYTRSDPGDQTVTVTADLPAGTEEVYNGSAFIAPYLGSTVQANGLELLFTLRRTGGWPSGRVTINVREADTDGEVMLDPITREHTFGTLILRVRSSVLSGGIYIRGFSNHIGGVAPITPFMNLLIKPAGGTLAAGTIDHPYREVVTYKANIVVAATTFPADGEWHTLVIDLATECAPYPMFQAISAKIVGAVDVDIMRLINPVPFVPDIDLEAPVANPTAEATLMSVDFDASDSYNPDTGDATELIISWAFGDGSTSSAMSPTHVYGTAGAYTATLTVTNLSGKSDSYSINVNVDIAVDGPLQWRFPLLVSDFAALPRTALGRRLMPPQSSYDFRGATPTIDLIRGLNLTENASPAHATPITVEEGWNEPGLGFANANLNQRIALPAGTGPDPAVERLRVIGVSSLNAGATSCLGSAGTNNQARHAATTRFRHGYGVAPNAQTKEGGFYADCVAGWCVDGDPRADAGGPGIPGKYRVEIVSPIVRDHDETETGGSDESIEAALLPLGAAPPPTDAFKGWGGINATTPHNGVTRAGWLCYGTVCTADNGADEFTNVDDHNLLTGDYPIEILNDGGALPGGVAPVTKYWLIRTGDTTFKLAASEADALAGVAVPLSNNGTGTHYLIAISSHATWAEVLGWTRDPPAE